MMRFFSDDEYEQIQRDHPEVGMHCPTCDGRGTYHWRGEDLECDCMDQRRRNLQYSHAGVGLKYQRLTWSDVDPSTNGLTSVLEYVENHQRYIKRGMGMYIHGDHGSGKSLVANLIIKDLVNAGYDCYATTFAATIDQLADSWRDPDDRRRFERRFMLSKVLLLDDLGRNLSTTKLAPSTFDTILRTRVQEDRPTIVTSNLSADAIEKRYDSGVLSLLVEQSIEVYMDSPDYRIKANKRVLDEVRTGQDRKIY